MHGFFKETFSGGGGQTNVSRNRGGGGRRLELKYIKLILMYFAACPSSAYSSCLISHSACVSQMQTCSQVMSSLHLCNIFQVKIG